MATVVPRLAKGECTAALRNDNIAWRVETMIYTTWIPLILIVAGRLINRMRYNIPFGIDDYLMVFAVIPISLGNIFHLVAIHYGLGQHVQCLNISQIEHTVKFQYLGEGMNVFSIWIVKLSICFFLLSLIKGTHKKARIVIWVLLGVNTAFNLVSFILWTMIKIPITALWNPSIPAKVDLSGPTVPFDQTVFIINAVIDFVLAFSPIYFLWTIQMQPRKKYVLWALLLLALLPAVAAIFKTVYLDDIFNEVDPSYVPAKAIDLAALAEQNGGTIISNLPYFGPFFDAAFVAVSGWFMRVIMRKENWRMDQDKTHRGTAISSNASISTYRNDGGSVVKPFDYTDSGSDRAV